jgi:hypothetical protein
MSRITDAEVAAFKLDLASMNARAMTTTDKADRPFYEIYWMGDDIDGYLGLAENGVYKIQLCDDDTWTVFWVRVEYALTDDPERDGTPLKDDCPTLARAKAIAERDNKQRRRAHPHGART